MKISIWHYPRNKQANYILDGMENDLLERVTIFAPRKRGKTEFILSDVAPNAINRGILPVYVDFWANTSSPVRVFCDSVLNAIERYKGSFKSIFKASNISSVKFANMIELKRSTGSLGENELSMANLAFDQLNRLEVPILLLLDEVQHLATSADFTPFTAALRSFMVNRPIKNVKGIFTGSSRDGLVKLFNNTKAPFYSSSSEIKFPKLDQDFVDYELSVFKDLSGKSLNSSEAYGVFETQFYEPGRFIELLKNMILDKVYEIHEGVERFDNSITTEKLRSYEALYQSIAHFDQTLLIQLADNKLKTLYSDDTYQTLSVINKGLTVKRHKVSNAIVRLCSKGILYSGGRGEYRFEDQDFQSYISSL
jgi:hypothetical protein